MKHPRRNILIVVAILIVVCMGALVYLFNMNHNSKVPDKPKEVILLDKIKNYDYHLEDRDTDLFKEKFNELKSVLESSKEINFSEYSKLLSELYIIDLYTITNKNNQYDVGGSEYVLPDSKENFELKVKDTLYKYVEDNSNGNRTQELPEVASINVLEVTEGEFVVSETTHNGYSVSLEWTYKKELGYDTKATVNCIKQDNKLYIVEQK